MLSSSPIATELASIINPRCHVINQICAIENHTTTKTGLRANETNGRNYYLFRTIYPDRNIANQTKSPTDTLVSSPCPSHEGYGIAKTADQPAGEPNG